MSPSVIEDSRFSNADLPPYVVAKIAPPDDNGCWLWTASVKPAGYGQAWDGHRVRNAHRYVYEALLGPVPEGLVLDHLCRIPACCNPSHMEPVTQGENVRRGNAGMHNHERWAKVTHCSRGHAYAEHAAWVPASGRRNGRRRICAECRRILKRARRARAREALVVGETRVP